MVKTTLVNTDLQEGQRVVKALDEAGFKVHSAFWYLFPEANEWRLVIASTYVEQLGPKRAYFQVQRILNSKRLNPPVDLTLRDISLVTPTHELIEHLIDGRISKNAYPYRLSGIDMPG